MLTIEEKKAELKAEIDRLQVWFAGTGSRAKNPKGWDERAELESRLVDQLLDLDD